MRRLIPFLLVLLAACGTKTETPPGGSAGGLRGSLKVHYDNPYTPESVQGIYVLLGDGSRFWKPVDGNGDALFEDPSLVGPQDVSVVVVSAKSPGGALVTTLLAVDQPEVELNRERPSPETSTQGTITGRVTGKTGTGSVIISVLGDGLYGYGQANADGTFSVDVWGVAPGRVYLVAEELAASTGSEMARFGVRRDIDVGGGQRIELPELALDSSLERALVVEAKGFEPYGGEVYAGLSFEDDRRYLFSAYAHGPSPLAVPTTERTGLSSTLPRLLSVSAGDADNLPVGQASVELPVGNDPSVSVTFLAPMQLTSPPVGPLGSPAVASRSGLTLRWSADPTAHLVQVNLVPGRSSEVVLSWTVMAPASITSFTPFELPAAVSPGIRALGAGTYQVETLSLYRADLHGHGDYFANGYDKRNQRVEERETRMRGYVELQ